MLLLNRHWDGLGYVQSGDSLAVHGSQVQAPEPGWVAYSGSDSISAVRFRSVHLDLGSTLEFGGSKLAVSNTCNRMNGGYTIGGKAIVIDKLASTMMACADPKLMALDQELGKRLQGKLGLRLSKGDARHLELTTATGDVLVFDSTPTAATRYGSAGERVFLEVGAQTKPCNHPLIAGKQCLQVRELKYDDKGIKTGTDGAFENFYGDIEGYAHEAGTRNVLRVKRYRIANPPADGSSLAYELDMVVESEIMKP